ncbi:MAG: helix-turn-helix transcriptional regulator [Clostridia bacterium]|nr:helix-turn-helix transcriptional regulator [Clostridia bacterium]
MSPKQYVINHRIKYAASLIITGYYTLQEISELCGYSDYKYFSLEFKKVIGVSPSKYTYKFDEIIQ